MYGKVRLKHGDRLVIGGNHYFKICNPQESKDNNDQVSTQPIDFEYAHQEILRIQEEKYEFYTIINNTCFSLKN